MAAGLMGAALAETGLVTYRAFKDHKDTQVIAGLPIPSVYVAVFVMYGVLGLIAGKGNSQRETAAALFGWGIVLATYMNLGDPATLKIGKAATTTVATGAGTGTAKGAGPTAGTPKAPHQ